MAGHSWSRWTSKNAFRRGKIIRRKKRRISDLYFAIDRASRIYLLTLFAKNEMENLKAADLRNFSAVIAALKFENR